MICLFPPWQRSDACRILSWTCCLGIISLWLAAVVGCQSKPTAELIHIHGTLTDEGKPLEVKNREVKIGRVVVGFCQMPSPDTPRDELVETTTADVNELGEFEVVDGIPPGSYLITIRQWDPYPAKDLLQEKYSMEKSKLIREFQSGESAELKLELSEL